MQALVEHAGFIDLLDGLRSVKAAKRCKLHCGDHISVDEAINVIPEEVMLMATHAQDCHGRSAWE